MKETHEMQTFKNVNEQKIYVQSSTEPRAVRMKCSSVRKLIHSRYSKLLGLVLDYNCRSRLTYSVLSLCALELMFQYEKLNLTSKNVPDLSQSFIPSLTEKYWLFFELIKCEMTLMLQGKYRIPPVLQTVFRKHGLSYLTLPQKI